MNVNLNNHVFLINEAKFSNNKQVVDEILCSFICPNKCMKCQDCLKAINRTYFDYIEFSGTDSDIKSKLDAVKTRFINEGLEKSGYKFYVIKDIDLLQKQYLNKILKFVEEPPKQTIAIFFTKNINNVIETIKSRCEQTRLTPNPEIARREIVQRFGEKDLDFYYTAFNNFEEINSFEQSKNKETIIKLSSFLKSQFEYDNTLIELSKKFKELDYQEMIILIRSIADNFNKNKYAKFLNLIKDLKFNLNKALVFDRIINIIKEEN